MFVKALSIKGFKSFAEPARLELEPGITVVVGPNGSGKSNVVDAIAWVLGAQAPTAVRSQKMDDVIFAGTATRAALGRAEVTLTIDNADGMLPIEFTEVTLTRTLFRSGESDYAINGVACRLLDVQELLSDSGVGRQQHIIVSQGQIDGVLNARPEERRLIIEEAAGVLKYRKRKERSERRLAATDENLNRIGDLVREVKRQLGPLERQAAAASRYEGLIGELGGLRLHLAGRELRALTAHLETAHRRRGEFTTREHELKGQLGGLDATVLDAEAELAALGGSDVGDILSRARSLRERLGGQTNVVTERRRRLERELRSSVDEGVVASLEAEAARIVAEADAGVVERAAIEPERGELEAAEAALEADRATFETRWGAETGPVPAQAAEVRARVSALESATGRDQQEDRRVREQLEAVAARGDRVAHERADSARAIARLELAVPRLEVELNEAQRTQDVAAREIDEATERRRDADADANRWQARADALAQALDAARSAAGVDALAGTEGVLGTLLDLVSIDDGWGPAVEAAIGEALQAVVVDDVARGRAALSVLTAKELAGAVLALGSSGRGQQAPPVGTPVRRYVNATRGDVAPLLDALLAEAVVIDGSWREALDAALAFPSATIVTLAGDRFGPSGWRLGRAGTGATGAALDEARAEQDRSARLAADAAVFLEESRQHQSAAVAAHRQAEESLRQARNELAEATRAVERQATLTSDVLVDHERLTDQKQEIADRSAVDRRKLQALQLELPGLEAAEAAHHDRVRAMAEARSSIEERGRVTNRLRSDLEVRTAAIDERLEMLASRQVEIEARLEHLVVERAEARVRREELERSLGVVGGLATSLSTRRETLDQWIGQLSSEQEVQSGAAREVSANLAARRRERQIAERELVELRERRSKVELAEAENRVRLETLTETIRRDLDAEPTTAMQAECPAIPDGFSPESRTRELERELKLMGPVNPLAVEEFAELKERHELISHQMDDIKSTKRDLGRLIREIDEQIVSVFSAAYADVATNFTELFTTLFPGGKGAVRLTNADDLLNCGVEIEAKPSGKNVKKLSLLSGGERSLTALGFLFAVFRSRPSPFYVMDEVEAALDDVNLDRFLALVQEFRRDAQLIIVSHQKRTMEAADVLYGVTMKPGGSSKVVSERIGRDRAADPTAHVTIDVTDARPDVLVVGGQATADAGTTTG